MVTLCTGLASSDSSEPIMNSPPGTTTISGQSAQSLKLSPGLRQRFSLPTSPSTPEQVLGEFGFEVGRPSSMAVERLPLFLSHCFLSAVHEQNISFSHAARSE